MSMCCFEMFPRHLEMWKTREMAWMAWKFGKSGGCLCRLHRGDISELDRWTVEGMLQLGASKKDTKNT